MVRKSGSGAQTYTIIAPFREGLAVLQMSLKVSDF